ncbi:hypothetical protein CI610_01880 [invertebrate metagenome]|uniref:DUF2057 domain-containing protein n=1 Tax=invertebrate metagenome TaxID=1711999 RepID=A0A2H9T7F7_9ZZZZ
MFKHRLLGWIAFSLLSVSAWASTTTLQLPQEAVLLVMDGQDITKSHITPNAPVPLNQGKHQIVFRVEKTFRHLNDRKNFTSEPLVLTFNAQTDKQYKIQLSGLTFFGDTSRFNKQPTHHIKLVNNSGGIVPFNMTILTKHGIQLGRNLVQETAEFNTQSHAASMPSLVTGYNKTTFPVVRETTTAPADTSENMLKYWWMQAAPEIRNHFKEWLKTEAAQ